MAIQDFYSPSNAMQISPQMQLNQLAMQLAGLQNSFASNQQAVQPIPGRISGDKLVRLNGMEGVQAYMRQMAPNSRDVGFDENDDIMYIMRTDSANYPSVTKYRFTEIVDAEPVQLQQIAIETANNNYETAQLINNQTNQMLQQNNTNLINAIQGFNQVNQNIASLSQQIGQLGYHMDQCCCEIKTQMLQDRLTDAQAALVAARGEISNNAQSMYILSQLGKFVPTTAAAAG